MTYVPQQLDLVWVVTDDASPTPNGAVTRYLVVQVTGTWYMLQVDSFAPNGGVATMEWIDLDATANTSKEQALRDAATARRATADHLDALADQL